MHPEISDLTRVIKAAEGKIAHPTIGLFYRGFVDNHLMVDTATILDSVPASYRDPIFHMFGVHVTKEKPMFLWEIARAWNVDTEVGRSLAAGVDFLWTLSLMYDDIVDDDEQRAGSMTAWRRFGKGMTMDSVRIGYDRVIGFIKERLGDSAKDKVMDSIAVGLKSVEKSRTFGLQVSQTEINQNYLDLMSFHTACPVNILSGFAQISKDRVDSAITSLKGVSFAGQLLNDLKDFMPYPIQGRLPFSDLKRRQVTIPLLALHQLLEYPLREDLEQYFNQQDLSNGSLPELPTDLTSLVAVDFNQKIKEIYLQSLNEYEIAIGEYPRIYLPSWVNYKMLQARQLLHKKQN